MESKRKLLENSAYRIFTEKLLDYMMQRAGLELPEGTVLGHCCLCDEYEWMRCISSADKEPMAVTATLRRGRFNMGDILVNTKRLNDRNGFNFFSLSEHQLILLSLNTIHELVHFWFDGHCDRFYSVMTKTGVIVDYDKPRNMEGYLMEQGIDQELMLNAAEFLVDTYNEIELSGIYRFVSLNNLLFRV